MLEFQQNVLKEWSSRRVFSSALTQTFKTCVELDRIKSASFEYVAAMAYRTISTISSATRNGQKKDIL